MKLKQERVTMLLSEQNAKFSLGISDRVYIVDEGRVVYEGTTTELKQAPGVMKRFLAV
jgi:branched-chain amino acid transport system ATP-binding protein